MARPDQTTRKVTIYIESDFAAELRLQTPSSADANLTETQVRTAILQLAEIWNQQTRSVALVYGGVANFPSANSFCSSVTASNVEKALYINFIPGMAPVNHAMTTRKAVGPACAADNHSEIVVWGTNFLSGSPTNWQLGSQGSFFSNAMLHELGHAVGLGHADDVNECRSVMAGCSNTSNLPFKLWGGRYPLTWDKECSRFYSQRSLSSRYVGFNVSGSNISSGLLHPDHEQANIASGIARTSSGSKYASIFHVGYGFFYAYHTKFSYLGSDGIFPFSQSVNYSSAPSDIANVYTAPVIHTLESLTSDATRISFVDDVNDSNSNIWYNPPYVQFIRASPSLNLIAADKSYRRCTNATCSSNTPIRSHHPIITTYDPKTQNDIAVSVITESMDGSDGDGRIRVHAGLSSGDYIFEEGELIPNNFPTNNTGWVYQGRTDLMPSVACADSSWPSSYNCLLVWVDKDLQDSRVLYTYFKVNNAGTEVFWDPNGTKIRGGSSTFTSPAVAYFGGKFFLAWRNFANSLYTFNSTAAYSWDPVNTQTPIDPLFGPPSFIHDSGREAALIYNTSNY